MFGLLNINKPVGPTSHDIVARVRKLLPRKTKVGHAGTLDPFAEGVLVLCVGKATRLADYVQLSPKTYQATFFLGAQSTTCDVQGEITPVEVESIPTQPLIQQVIEKFRGEISQIPPAHSAVHVQGRRAYELARSGVEFELSPRNVTIHEIDVLRYDWPELEIKVKCSSGTYIRSLARDIARDLGTDGYCKALTRTAIGRFEISQAVSLDGLDEENIAQFLLHGVKAVSHLPQIIATNEHIEALRFGSQLKLQVPIDESEKEYAIVDEFDKLLAIAKPVSPTTVQPTKVLIKTN